MDITIANNSQKTNVGQLSATQLTATVGAALLALVIISGNLLVITAFVIDKNIRSITNRFLVSLAIADLLVGGIVTPIFMLESFVLNNEQWSGAETLCYIFNVIDIFTSSSSIFHLCVIAGDRYMAIVHPMKYPAKMTRRLSLVLIGTAWCLAVGVSGLWIVLELGLGRIRNTKCWTSFSPLFAMISSCVSFFLPAIFMMIFYTKTFLTARAHIKRIQRGRMVLSGDGAQDAMRIHRGGGAASTGASAPATAMNSEYKVAKTLGLVIGAFLLCWLPYFTFNVILPFCNGQWCNSISSLRYLSYWLGYINSAINPFIYAFTNSSFRIAFLKIICCLRHRRRDQRTANTRPTAGQTTNMQINNINPVSLLVEFPLAYRYF